MEHLSVLLTQPHSECCELVKLCDINCSGPGFLETHCSNSFYTFARPH